MSQKRVDDLGKTLETYRKIAIALNSLPKDQKISIEDLAGKAKVHWNTAKKALFLFSALNKMSPEFRMESQSKFRIIKKPRAMDAVEGIFESLEMRILVKLFLANAVEEKNARKDNEFLGDDEKRVLQELVSRGLVNSIEGRFYLSKRGQSLASIGMRELAKLGIELPWEESIKKRSPEPLQAIYRREHVCWAWISGKEGLVDFKKPRPYVWQSQRDFQGWQSHRDERERALSCLVR